MREEERSMVCLDAELLQVAGQASGMRNEK
jgi:hypothetical protein